MPKQFKCPYCDTPPQRMRSDAKTCGEWVCQKRHQNKSKQDKNNDQLLQRFTKHAERNK